MSLLLCAWEDLKVQPQAGSTARAFQRGPGGLCMAFPDQASESHRIPSAAFHGSKQSKTHPNADGTGMTLPVSERTIKEFETAPGLVSVFNGHPQTFLFSRHCSHRQGFDQYQSKVMGYWFLGTHR